MVSSRNFWPVAAVGVMEVDAYLAGDIPEHGRRRRTVCTPRIMRGAARSESEAPRHRPVENRACSSPVVPFRGAGLFSPDLFVGWHASARWWVPDSRVVQQVCEVQISLEGGIAPKSRSKVVVAPKPFMKLPPALVVAH